MYNGWRRFNNRFEFFRDEFGSRILDRTMTRYNWTEFYRCFMDFGNSIELRDMMLNIWSFISDFTTEKISESCAEESQERLPFVKIRGFEVLQTRVFGGG